LNFIVLIIAGAVLLASCEHTVQANLEPEPEVLPPCDNAGRVHFDNDLMPIITSHCAIPGCHDAQTPTAFIDLSNYDAIMNAKVLGEPIVVPGDKMNSKLYRAVRGLDLIFMPAPYQKQLNNQQRAMFGRWIDEGAQRLDPCVDLSCDTTKFDWSTTIRPIMDVYCRGCHFKDYPGGGINLDYHSQVQEAALDGLLWESVIGQAPARLMPLDKPMPDCQITQIRKWIENGAPRD
jgi:hypothetical protein